MSLSNETHKLPIPPNAKGEKNFASIIEKINNFLGTSMDLTPLFTLEENIPMIDSIIQELCSADKSGNHRYEILPLNQLFFDLKGQIAIRSIDGTLGFKSIDEATHQLNQDKYIYFQQIACQVSSTILYTTQWSKLF